MISDKSKTGRPRKRYQHLSMHEMQQRLSKYMGYRNEIRKNFKRNSSEYVSRVKAISKEIDRLQTRIRHRAKVNTQLAYYYELVCKHFKISMKAKKINFARSRKPKIMLARYVFIKFVLEKIRTRSTYVNAFLGIKDPWHSTKARLRFTRTFDTNEANKEAYHRFKEFAERMRANDRYLKLKGLEVRPSYRRAS